MNSRRVSFLIAAQIATNCISLRRLWPVNVASSCCWCLPASCLPAKVSHVCLPPTYEIPRNVSLHESASSCSTSAFCHRKGKSRIYVFFLWPRNKRKFHKVVRRFGVKIIENSVAFDDQVFHALAFPYTFPPHGSLMVLVVVVVAVLVSLAVVPSAWRGEARSNHRESRPV